MDLDIDEEMNNNNNNNNNTPSSPPPPPLGGDDMMGLELFHIFQQASVFDDEMLTLPNMLDTTTIHHQQHTPPPPPQLSFNFSAPPPPPPTTATAPGIFGDAIPFTPTAFPTPSQTPRTQTPASPSLSSTGASSSGKPIRRSRESSKRSAPYVSTKKRLEMADDPSEKSRLKKRLARKAELARSSRKRKKAYVQDLEDKVEELGRKIEELQQQQQEAASNTPTTTTTTTTADQCVDRNKHIRAALYELVRKQPGELTGAQVIQIAHLTHEFVKNSRQRQSQFAYHLEQMQKCLTPGLQTRFALWGLNQEPEFYTESNLWKALMLDEVGATPAQVQRLMSFRSAVALEAQALHDCQAMVVNVYGNVQQHIQRLNSLMDRLTAVFTPIQLAKFYLWVDENQWSMEMLNEAMTNSAITPVAATSTTSSSSSSSTTHTSSG